MTQHLHMVVWVFALWKRSCGGHRLPTQWLAWLIKQIRCTGVLLILHLQILNFLLYGGSFSDNNLEIKIIIKLTDWMTQNNLNHHILLLDCQIKLKVRYYTELTGICKVKCRSTLSTIPINNSHWYTESLNRLPIWNSQNCSMFPLAFVAGWLQGHWWGFISRNYVVWPIFLLMNVFISLKGSHFWFLFDFTAAGVVPCGGLKTSPRTSTIVQFIFCFGPLRSAIIFWEIRNKWLV